MAGVGGAADPGRLSLAGTEARPTELFSYKVAVNKLSIFMSFWKKTLDEVGEEKIGRSIIFCRSWHDSFTA